jgi:hypothetical protein
MGQFKPMVKMETTEPSVILKLKKGGSATFDRMKKEGAKEGFKPVKKMDGGAMGALADIPAPTTPMGNPAAAKAMATRRMMKRPAAMPRGTPAVGRPKAPPMMPPMGAAMPAPAMKKGGKMDVSAKLKKHADMPASKAHKGLKTGGIAKSTQPGEYATGGVVNAQGGFKNGGIIKTMTKKTTKHVTAKPDHNSAPTGDVKLGNAGGYKRGGRAKKHFATGGRVDSGHPVAMPQGNKPPSTPVSINRLSGTFKDGGKVKKSGRSC